MKKILLFITSVTALAVILFGVQYVADRPYRQALPGPGALSNPVKEQVGAAYRMAALFTTASSIGELGMSYQSCLDYKNAAACYALAVKKNQSQWVWNYYFGLLALEQGQSAVALGQFREVIQKDPANSFAFYYAGEACRTLGLDDSAAALFLSVMARPDPVSDKTMDGAVYAFPIRIYAQFGLARLKMAAGLSDTAALLLSAIIRETESFGPAYRMLATLYQERGDTVQANQYRVRANDLADFIRPQDALVGKIAAISQSDQYLLKEMEDALRSRQGVRALTLCTQALRFYPDNKELISTFVFENFRQGHDDAALPLLDRHYALYKDDPKELMDMMDMLYNRLHLAEAIHYFDRVKTLLPDNPALADWLFERGKKDEAMAMIGELRKKKPADPVILAGEIRLWVGLGDVDRAMNLLSALARQDSVGIETARIKGWLDEKKGKLDSAGLAYESAYRLDPGDLVFTRQLIGFYISQRNWQPAIDHFKGALHLYPNEPFLLEGLGRLLISCPDSAFKNTQEGIEFTKRAFTNYRSPTQTMLSAGKTLATVYLSLGDKHLCVVYANKTIGLAREIQQQDVYLAYFKSMVSM